MIKQEMIIFMVCILISIRRRIFFFFSIHVILADEDVVLLQRPSGRISSSRLDSRFFFTIIMIRLSSLLHGISIFQMIKGFQDIWRVFSSFWILLWRHPDNQNIPSYDTTFTTHPSPLPDPTCSLRQRGIMIIIIFIWIIILKIPRNYVVFCHHPLFEFMGGVGFALKSFTVGLLLMFVPLWLEQHHHHSPFIILHDDDPSDADFGAGCSDDISWGGEEHFALWMWSPSRAIKYTPCSYYSTASSSTRSIHLHQRIRNQDSAGNPSTENGSKSHQNWFPLFAQ